MERNFFNLVEEKIGCTADCRVYIDIPYEQKDEAKKKYKARWEPLVKQWYFYHDLEDELPTYKYKPKYIISSHYNAEELQPFLDKYINKYKKALEAKHNKKPIIE